MHFHHKTLPQKPMKQATVHTGRHVQTTHITVQCIYRVATIPIYIFPTTPTPFAYMWDVNSGSVCVANEYIGGCGR